MAEKKGFYMIYVEGCATPTYKHQNIDSAQKEAERLSTLYKKKAYILGAIKSVENVQFNVVELSLNDDLPF